MGKRRGEATTEEEMNGVEESEYEVVDLRDKINSTRGSRFKLMENELGLESIRRKFSRQIVINGLKDLSQGLVIHPENWWYRTWEKFILVWAIYSSFFTPFEFGFFRGLPEKLFFLDICGQIVFLVDIVVQFFVAYRDSQTYRMVYKRSPIALRYLKSHFVIDLLSCMPWDIIYKAVGEKEEVRYLLWIRLCRARRVTAFFQKLEKDIRINYLFTRIIKLITVELYCTHTAACIFYYLATTLPEQKEGYTWIGSLKLGDYSYSHFREIDLWTRYTSSMYFAIVTMATVGYGDVHAVNNREMIFVMIYVSFDMILGAYLIGNMTALIVKGSKTERYRDKMTDLLKYMNRNRLGKSIRSQIKGHLRLQYESNYTDSAVLQDMPISIRAKISQSLYQSYIENVPLFKGCSAEFIGQIVTKVCEEFFLPGEVIMEQGNAIDQLYFICDGVLEQVIIGKDGTEETVALLEPNSSFGEVSILCNIPQPYTIRVCELSRLLRIDKQSFSNIVDIYFHDGRRILTNLLEVKESKISLKQLNSDITFHIEKQEAELALKVNCAAYHGDLNQLKTLIRAGADPKQKDYDGRSPLHLAASRGYEEIALYLIREDVDLDAQDNFGNTPLFEAIKNGHDRVASLLVKEGASLKIENAGSFLCSVVTRGDSDLLRRLLSNGVDSNSKDYNHQTPLHVAASQGSYLMANLLLEAHASVLLKDRWGNTAVDEAIKTGNKQLIELLNEAKSAQLSKLPAGCLEDLKDNQMSRKKCTVFPFHPEESKDVKKPGVVLWVPGSVEELVKTGSEQLSLPSGSFILTEDGGKIIDVDTISDGQKLYLISETH
ncbi:potassium channel SKOR-like [Ipomoea triloba]|uniref:potassium channel SKOR-like n=1 Tax=Ipomoea triloba TaxID=35885 RepID=UPI00125E6DA8|nr:potassium channel SKOR-like [Ipomoea triloba]